MTSQYSYVVTLPRCYSSVVVRYVNKKQWRAVTSEVGHAVDMPTLVKQYFMGRTKKIVWDPRTKTKFRPKIMLFTKKVFTLHQSRITHFLSKNRIVLKKKKKKEKKKSSPEISLRFFTFRPKIIVFSEKQKTSSL